MSQPQDISAKLKDNPYFASLRIPSCFGAPVTVEPSADQKKIDRRVKAYQSGRGLKYIAHLSNCSVEEVIETLKEAGVWDD